MMLTSGVDGLGPVLERELAERGAGRAGISASPPGKSRCDGHGGAGGSSASGLAGLVGRVFITAPRGCLLEFHA